MLRLAALRRARPKAAPSSPASAAAAEDPLAHRLPAERSFGTSNRVARFAARIADQLAKRRRIDDLADYVDRELRFEFVPAFEYAMAAFSIALMAPVIYVVTEGIVTPSRLVVWMGAMSEADYKKSWAPFPWWSWTAGHGMLFYCVYQLTPYVRYPFFVHVLAPFFRRRGWVRRAANSLHPPAAPGAPAGGPVGGGGLRSSAKARTTTMSKKKP